MDIIMTMLMGFTIVGIIDGWCWYKYGSPSLSILIAKCRYSKHFRWVSYDILGDSEGYCEYVMQKMRDRRAH